MKKWFAVMLIVVGCAAGISAQDLRPVGTDLSTMLGGIGDSVLTNFQQAVLADNGVGPASLGKSHFYFGISLGAALSNGLLGFVDNPNEFQVVNVNGLISDNLSGGTSTYYSEIKKFFPDPNLKVVAGVRLLAGVEVIGTFSIVPQALIDSLGGSIGAKNITLNSLSAGVLLRKVLLEDEGGFPALSIGLGYTYADLNLGYNIQSFSQGFSGGSTLTLGGNLKMGWTMSTAGVEIDVSKRLFILVPYLKFMPYYQWSSFSGGIDNFTAGLSNNGTPITPTNPAGNPSSDTTLNTMGFIVGGGVEIELGGFKLVPSGSYDFLTKTPSVNFATRLQL